MSSRFSLRHGAVVVLLGSAAIFSAMAAGAVSPTPPPPGLTIQQRIDALLKRRLNPEPLPVDLPNPFQVVKGNVRTYAAEEISNRPAVTEENSGAIAPARISAQASNADVLASTTARLKVGGFIVVKDQIQVVINGVPRREGDMIAADWNKNLVYLRVVRVLASEVVLRYGDAEATLKL